MRKLSDHPDPSPRLLVTFPQEMKDWLTEQSNEYVSQAEIVRTAIQLLMDLDWKPENEN